MLYLTLITVGEMPRGGMDDARQALEKPLKAYVKLDRIICKSTEAAEERAAKADYLIVLEANGANLTSEAFAETLKTLEDQGQHLTVLLGGAKGLSDEIKKHADLLLSLSKMTTTHDLAHLFFLEQLYRAMTIAHGKTYHY